MIFEDAHWIDPTSLELLGRIVDKIPTLRMLLIVTIRPEFEPPWIGWPYVTAITVNNAGSGYTSPPAVTVAPPPSDVTYVTYWSNDGTSTAGSQPSAAVNVTVNNGLFT